MNKKKEPLVITGQEMFEALSSTFIPAVRIAIYGFLLSYLETFIIAFAMGYRGVMISAVVSRFTTVTHPWLFLLLQAINTLIVLFVRKKHWLQMADEINKIELP